MKNGRDTAINELQQFWTATGQTLQKCFLRSNPRGLTWWSMVKSLRFYCREHRLHPWLGSWVPACHSEIKKKKKSTCIKSACNERDPGSIPGSGRSPEKGIGYPLQYCWASLVTQMVKNLPLIQETQVWSLSWEDPLEKGMATTPLFLPGEFHNGKDYEKAYKCMYSWVTLLSSRNWHNVVNQLYFD